MKSLIQFLLSSVLLINTPSLLAQASSASNEVTQDSVVNNSIPISNLPSSISHLDVAPKLMMNPSLEEGTKAIGEALGVFGKRTITAEGTAVEGAGRSNVVNAVSSSNVLRLRGGGSKKSQTTGGLKSAGDDSDEEEMAVEPDVESEDTQAMGSEVNKYLKNEIINNIYTECLAEVAKLSLSGCVTAESASQEAAEWTAAEKAAEYSKGKIERAFEKAVREIDEAKSMADEAKRNLRELEKAPKPANTMDQAVTAAALAYEKAYAAYTASDYKAKKLVGDLTEARVETASAVLHAITVRKSTQHASTAEAGLEEAKETEMVAAQTVEAAKADVATKADLLSKAEENLNAAKRAVIGSGGSTPTSPMTAAQKVAMREIEFDQKIAEKALLKAKEVELTAHVAKGKIREMNFERELKAYHDAEEAWTETVEGYKTALAKAEEAGLSDRMEELIAALASAEVHQATWRADSRWVKARRADQDIATSGTSLDHLALAEETWVNAIEGYKMALAKATKANMKCVELTTSLNDAVSAQERVAAQSKLARQAQVKRITGQIEEAEQASKEKRGGENAYLWDRIITKLEQSRESWNKVSELIAEGKREKAIFWRKVAEESETSTNGIRQAVQAYISGNDKEARQLEKEAWSAYYLSDASTWTLKSEEALEKANQVKSEGGNFWRNLAEQYKMAADYERKASEAHMADKIDERGSCFWVGRCLYSSANRILKAKETRETGKGILANGYQEAAEISEKAAEWQKQALTAYASGKESEGHSWAWGGESLQFQADYQVKACEAQEVGKATLAAGYRGVAIISERAAELCELSAQACAVENEYVVGKYWGLAGKSLQAKADYQAKAIEARKAGKTQLAVGYSEAGATSQRAADQYEQAVKTRAAGKGNEGVSWSLVGKSLQRKAECQVKLSEAETAGKATLAAGYREVTVIFEQVADHWRQVKECENISWRSAGQSLQSKADYQVKAIEAQEAGKTILAAGYREAAETYQQVAEQRKQEALASAAGKEREGSSWGWVGSNLQKKAYYQVKAIEAQEAGKTQLAAGYREAAMTFQSAADQREKSALTHAAGKEREGDFWGAVGLVLTEQADYEVKAIEAQEAGKLALAAGYREAIKTFQKAAKHLKQAAKIYSLRNAEAESWFSVGVELRSQADYQVKACEAQEAGETILAEGYRVVLETVQRTLECAIQQAQSFADGKQEEGESWNLASNSFGSQKGCQVKAMEARQIKKEALAVSYREIAVTYQRAAEQYKQSAQTIAEWKGAESLSWRHAGKSLQSKAEYEVKAIEAQEAGKIQLVAGYREIAATLEQIADQWKQSALALASGKKNEGVSWELVVKSLQAVADYQVKAITAEEAGKATLAAGYKEVIAISQRAVDQIKKSITTKVVGKESEGVSWELAGKSLQAVADYQAKAIEAEEAGKMQLAAGYREVAAISERAADQYKQAAGARAVGNESEAEQLSNEGKRIQAVADALVAEKTGEKGTEVKVKADEGKQVIGATEKPLQEPAKNLSPKSPSAAEVTPIKGGGASSSSSTPNHSLNPSVESAREAINHQGDSSNLNQRINQPTAYSLQATVSIRPVGRIVTVSAPSTFSPLHQASATLKTDSQSVDTSAKKVENTPNKQAESPSPKKLSWYEKKAVTAEQEANSAFAHAESNPTEENWLKAKTKAQIAEHDWNEVVKSKRLPAEIEEAKAQKAIWTEKIALASRQSSKG
ncbi:MAG TPA: hypothetical protein VJK54_08145 [Chthoniobacterales bacterium]|nr:hypothetical protein [Chthoniobacterales bacterium]